MDRLDPLAHALDLEEPTPDETAAILQVARDVAHTVERRITPVATFLLGMSVQRRVAAGATRSEAISGAIEDLRGAMPEEPPEERPEPTE